MADIVNRSPFVVEVESTLKKNPYAELTKQFPYKQKADAVSYATTLLERGLPALITQLETSFQVRIRAKGVSTKSLTYKTLDEAEKHLQKLTADKSVGLFRDYVQGAQTTTAELIQRYIVEECPALGGGDNYITMLRAMLEDSENKLRKRIEQRKREMREHGKTLTPLGANREPMTSLEWLHLPLTKVRPEHFHDFIRDRLEYVEASTVDRNLDLLSRIYNLAQTRWRIHLDVHPMLGIKRPKYFNERDRRLVGDEEMRLLEAARKEDQLRSFELHVNSLAADDVAAALTLDTRYAVNDSRKAAYERARRRALEEGFPHVPLFEAFLMFQLATAARRGETLGLFWNQVSKERQLAALPTSKNGRPRKLAIRSDILALMDQLPKTSDLVFDIGIKELSKAWGRICKAAGVEDLHIHDLRHEGISRAAESGRFPTVLDLQAYSGHRDIRSLSRYTHLCMTAIAKRLEEAEVARQETLCHKGRQRLKSSQLLWLGGTAPTSTGIADAQLDQEPSPSALNVVPFRSRSAS